MSFLDHECGFGASDSVNPNLGGIEPEAKSRALWVPHHPIRGSVRAEPNEPSQLRSSERTVPLPASVRRITLQLMQRN